MRRHFAIPEGIGFVAVERDIRQSGRGGQFYNWDAVPPNTMILVPETLGKSLSHYYLKVHGNAAATNDNKVVALSYAVQELTAETTPAIAAKMVNTMTTNAVQDFQSNEKSVVLIQSFRANEALRKQQRTEQDRARNLAMEMEKSGLNDFLAEEEEKVRQKRYRREARERGEE